MKIVSEKTKVFTLSILVSFALFGASLYFDFFIFDDAELIYDNYRVKNPTFSNMFEYWSLSNTPIVYNTWQLISMLFGVGEALPYRLLNIFLHGVNCSLVYIWCKEILCHCIKADSDHYGQLAEDFLIQKASFIGLVIFILHPVHVESVVWVSSLKEILAGTFGLVSFICYLKGGGQAQVRSDILSPLFYLAGMLTHPTIAALPLVYVWLDLALFKKNMKETFFRNGIYLLLLVSAVVIHKTVNPQIHSGAEQPIFLRIAVAFNALFAYLEKYLLPFKYSFDYMMTPSDVALTTKALMWPKIKAFLAVVFIWLAILSIRKKKYHFFHFSIMVFILLVSVNLGFIGYAFQNISTVADRFLYFPSIGFSLFFAFIYLLCKRRQSCRVIFYFKVALGIYLLIIFFITVQRIHLWKSSHSVLNASIENGYVSYPLNISLGVSLAGKKKYDEALIHFENAYEISQLKNKDGYSINNLDGNEPLAHMYKIFIEQRDETKGVELYNKLVSSKHDISPELSWVMSEYFLSLKRWYEAEKLISFSFIWYPDSKLLEEIKQRIAEVKEHSILESYVNLGMSELDSKRYSSAKKNFKKAMELTRETSAPHLELVKLIKRADQLASEDIQNSKQKKK